MIRFSKNREPLQVDPGINLMKALIDGGLPVASSCSGEGVCAKCRVKVVQGAENLSLPNGDEQDLRDIHDLAREERISCQVTVHGDITVDTKYW